VDLLQAFRKFFTHQIPISPAMFRRGKLPTGELVYRPDPNSRHIGAFGDKVIPMKRRFKGVSRTAK
jgi:hypothetical protein